MLTRDHQLPINLAEEQTRKSSPTRGGNLCSTTAHAAQVFVKTNPFSSGTKILCEIEGILSREHKSNP
jgi:hypothetical protein